MAREIPVAIGIDEAGINDDRDMFQEMRLVLNVHREPGIDSRSPTASEVFKMASENGAGTTIFADMIGRLEPGRAADIVLLDWDKLTWPYQSPEIPLVDVLVHRARRRAVDTVIIQGSVVFQQGKFVNVDQEETLKEIAAMLKKPLSSSEAKRRPLSEEILPFVKEFYDGYLVR